MQQTPLVARLYRLVLGLFCLTLATPLLAYSYNGLSMRFSGDDYCYASVLRLHGFFETQWYSYLHVSTYNGDRYSLTLFSSLAGIFSPVANGVLPVLAILFFLGGIVWVLYNMARLTNPQKNHPDLLLIVLAAEAIVFFTLYLAPSLGQSLYWRSGMLPYLAPLIVNTFLIAVILSGSRKEKSLWGSLLACFLLSILAGGFSETGVALQAAYLGLAFIGCVSLSSLKIGAWPRRATWLTTISLAGTLVAMVLLLISPANHDRMIQLPASPGLLETISLALHGALSFAYSSIKSQIIPDALLVVMFFLLGLANASVHPNDRLFSWRSWIIACISVGLAGAVLLFTTMVPFAYMQHAYPEPRALITSRFVMVVCQAAIGWLFGVAVPPLLTLAWKPGAVSRDTSPRVGVFLVLAAVVFLLAVSVYPLRAARSEFSQSPHYQKWARFWDARNLTIIQAQKEGFSNVKVINIDHIIPNVAELSPDAKFWYNGCAASYYGVTAISASLPGWDQ
jgi:hypothetical protein